MKTELMPGYDAVLLKLIVENNRWNRAYMEIKAALAGDPIAISNNHKEVERLRERERGNHDELG